MKTTLSLLVLPTSNLDACLDFYRQLELAFVEEKHGTGPTHYSCLSESVVIELYPAVDGTLPPGYNEVVLGFTVYSLDGTLRKLQEIGVQVVKLPSTTQWGRRAFVLDPDGRRVAIDEIEKPSP